MPRLIVISVDGLAGFYWTDMRAKMPTLRRLAAQGVVASKIETAFPSTRWPGHALCLRSSASTRSGYDPVSGELMKNVRTSSTGAHLSSQAPALRPVVVQSPR